MPGFFSIAKYTLITLVAFVLGIGISGQNPRDYKVLSDVDNIKIGSSVLSIKSIAEQYKPYIYENMEHETSKFLFMWYEAIPTGKNLILTFRPVWEDERNSQAPIQDSLYRLYRRLYYGNPPIDTEYVQIVVDLSTGKRSLIKFETPEPNYDFLKLLQPHYQVEITDELEGKGSIKRILNPQGIIISENSLDIEDSSSLRLAVVTWNHLFAYVQKENSDQFLSFRQIDAELRHLSEEDYRMHRFARRSQGSFSRRVGIVEALPTFLAILFVLISCDILLFHFVINKQRFFKLMSQLFRE